MSPVQGDEHPRSGARLEGRRILVIGSSGPLVEALEREARAGGAAVVVSDGGFEPQSDSAPDVVIAVIAATELPPVHRLPLDRWRDAVTAPLRACFRIARTAVEGFLSDARAGRLVLVVDAPPASSGSATVLEAALRAFASSFAREYGRRSLACNVIVAVTEPGKGTTAAAAEHAVFLASSDAAFVNGEVLAVRGTATGPDVLDTGDIIAREILADLGPIEFIEAEDASHRETCWRLRYRAVVEQGLAPAEAFPGGVETDAYDEEAVHILGLHEGRPVATLRVVLPTPGRPLPAVVEFGLHLPDPAATVEWGRVVVDPGYRGDGHSVFMGLAARAWLATRRRGFANIVGATPQRLIALFEALGLSVRVLGEARHYWGEERYPVLCQAGPTITSLERDWLARPSSRASSHETDPKRQ